MPIYVAVCGATISCNQAEGQIGDNTIKGTTDEQTKGCSGSILTENDFVKDENLFNFNAVCKFNRHKITGRMLPCNMSPIGGWKFTAKGFGDTEERILKSNSKFNCIFGGTVKIIDPNQDQITTETIRTHEDAVFLELKALLEARKEDLENIPRRGGHAGRNEGRRRANEIAAIEADLARINVKQRPLLDYLDNETSRHFQTELAGIDRELLDVTIQHEGGNFHSKWFSPAWPAIQENFNDVSGGRDTSVGYGQMQPRNAVAIGKDTFGLELSYEEARERLSGDNEFSNAIIAEFLSQRTERIDQEHRNNRVIFTSYAMSPKTIELFNEIDWDFTRAEQLVEEGELKESTYNDLYDRYYTHYPNALDALE